MAFRIECVTISRRWSDVAVVLYTTKTTADGFSALLFSLPFLLIWCVWETQHVLCMLNKSADFLGFFLPFTVRTGQFAYVLHLICFDALLCFWLNRGWCVDHVYIVRHTSNSTVFRPNWLEAIYRQRLRNSQHHGFSRVCVCVYLWMVLAWRPTEVHSSMKMLKHQ